MSHDVPATPAGAPGKQTTEPPVVRQPPLWRNLQFQTLWIGTTMSTLGLSVTDVAYPLTILAITGSPGIAGLFAAIQALGMLVAGLPAGSIADRYDSRTIVIVTETCRAAVTVGVVIAQLTGWLSVPVLLCAAVLIGSGQAVKGTASLLLMRSVVPSEQLTRALTQDEVRMNGAAMAGPALGGGLYAIRALAHAVPFIFTAGSFVISVLCAALMKILPGAIQPERPEEQSGGAEAAGKDGGMLAGVRVLWDQPLLRAAGLLIMIVNTIGAGLELIIIVILRHHAVPSGEIGLALGIGAAGGLAGAPLIGILHRLRPGVLLLTVCMVETLIFVLLSAPFGPWWTAGLLFVAMLGVPSLRVLIDILVIRQAPSGQRGRVVAALMTLIGLGVPAGLAVCGLLLQYLPAQAALLALAAVQGVGVAYCATKRELWQARWPVSRDRAPS